MEGALGAVVSGPALDPGEVSCGDGRCAVVSARADLPGTNGGCEGGDDEEVAGKNDGDHILGLRSLNMLALSDTISCFDNKHIGLTCLMQFVFGIIPFL